MITSVEFSKYNKVDSNTCLSGDIILWGENNMYPLYLYQVITECSLLNSILSGSIDFTVGNGIKISNDKYNDLLLRLITDRWYFGGFCFQVLYNMLGNIVDLVYTDIRFVRSSKDEKHYYIYNDYIGGSVGIIGQPKAKLPVFDITRGKEEPVQLYYYKGNKTRDYYPLPDYSTSLISAETLIEIDKFHYNTIINNFTASAIINFKGSYNKEMRDELNMEINRNFSGSKNAARFLCTFNESPTMDNSVTVERLQSDDFDTKYQAVRSSCVDSIYQSLRAMPQLFGLNYNTGFSTIEYEDAFKLYNKTSVIPKQNELIKVFNSVGVDLSFDCFVL